MTAKTGCGLMKTALKLLAAAGATLVLAVAGLYAFIYFSFSTMDSPFDNRAFERELWIKFHKDRDPDNPRGEMYDNLVNTHLHKGMTREQVIELLGKPDRQEEKRFLSYNLGMWSGFRVDYDSLDLQFGPDGLLTSFHRVQH